MVESYEPKSKRQKTSHQLADVPINSKKVKKAAQGGLINVNVEEYVNNPEAFEPEQKESSGKQVIIQFKDAEDKEVGMQISVDSLVSKKDLNAMLAEFLPEPDENETVP